MISIIKYSCLRLLRNKANIFWILLFPILLGCMFKAAMSNLSSSENLHAIPVAIVYEEGDAVETFRAVAEELGKEGEGQLLSVTVCGEEEALRLLEEKEIDGILYANDQVSLTVSSNMVNAQLNQSILKTFVEQYNLSAAAITDTAMTRPQLLPALAERLSENTGYCEDVSLSLNGSDSYTQYYYNIIAMACLFTAMGGLLIAIENQGNLTTLAARKNISATHKLTAIVGELLANICFEYLLNVIAFFCLIYILRVDLTARLPLALFTILISTVTGVTFGFLIGAIGHRSEHFKTGIVFAVVMPCCFFSGLMVGSMRIILEQYVPFINRINPAALICDSFYCLAMYESLDRFIRNILTLILLSVIFCFTGFLLTRRKKYASL